MVRKLHASFSWILRSDGAAYTWVAQVEGEQCCAIFLQKDVPRWVVATKCVNARPRDRRDRHRGRLPGRCEPDAGAGHPRRGGCHRSVRELPEHSKTDAAEENGERIQAACIKPNVDFVRYLARKDRANEGTKPLPRLQ